MDAPQANTLPKRYELVGRNHDPLAHDLSSKLTVQDVQAMTDECILSLLEEQDKLPGSSRLHNLHLLTHEMNHRALAGTDKDSCLSMPRVWLSVVAVCLVGIAMAAVSHHFGGGP